MYSPPSRRNKQHPVHHRSLHFIERPELSGSASSFVCIFAIQYLYGFMFSSNRVFNILRSSSRCSAFSPLPLHLSNPFFSFPRASFSGAQRKSRRPLEIKRAWSQGKCHTTAIILTGVCLRSWFTALIRSSSPELRRQTCLFQKARYSEKVYTSPSALATNISIAATSASSLSQRASSATGH